MHDEHGPRPGGGSKPGLFFSFFSLSLNLALYVAMDGWCLTKVGVRAYRECLQRSKRRRDRKIGRENRRKELRELAHPKAIFNRPCGLLLAGDELPHVVLIDTSAVDETTGWWQGAENEGRIMARKIAPYGFRCGPRGLYPENSGSHFLWDAFRDS